MAPPAAAVAASALTPSLVTRKLLESIKMLPPKPPKLILDSLSPTPSHLLNVSLSHQLPRPFFPAYFQPQHRVARTFRPPAPAQAVPMQTGHHLVYFPPQMDPLALMPDGTDPDHCPGPPFVRRMWAGGSVEFAPGWEESFRLDGRQVSCVETVGPPDLKLGASEADEKLFVDVTRRYFVGDVENKLEEIAHQASSAPSPAISEVRRLVFLRADTPERERRAARKPMRAQREAAFQTVIRPDRALLFHFSALTFNAHAIHLDRDYTRREERHHDLLVHGPLSLFLILSALHVQAGDLWRVARLEYRNLAPLYVDEPLTVGLNPSVSRTKALQEEASEGGDDMSPPETIYNLWISGPEGGLAVKGSARLERKH
ncbi:hypothetical protein GQ53DRAFT_839410 [Thozetella sp. PMI_491]|nr:hypothetical protein GQ53DRAFT_839410 [Thozetella sp. PMI_491]